VSVVIRNKVIALFILEWIIYLNVNQEAHYHNNLGELQLRYHKNPQK